MDRSSDKAPGTTLQPGVTRTGSCDRGGYQDLACYARQVPQSTELPRISIKFEGIGHIKENDNGHTRHLVQRVRINNGSKTSFPRSIFRRL
jgi:hypothetical protein